VSSDIKTEIVAAIAKTNDENMKVVLMLMLGVVSDIGDRIEALRRDEQGLRAAVLNGHEPVHHAHHEWITRKMEEEAEEAKADKASRRKIRDGLIERGLWAALALLLLLYGVVLK
jgi:hypothetical protein